MYTESADLEKLITKAKHHEFAKYVSQRKQMIKTIEDFLNKNIN